MALNLKQPVTISELAQLIDAELGNGAAEVTQKISHIAKSIDDAGLGSITFLSNPFYKKYLPDTKATVVLLAAADAKDCPTACLISKNPRLSLAKLLVLCNTEQKIIAGVHPSAVLGRNVKLGKDVSIGPNCVIGNDSEISDGVVLQAGVVIGDACNIGALSEIRANVVIYSGVSLGVNCIIHSNTVIGSDGFGYANDAAGNWVKMLHLGGVTIGNDVEIGACTSIDRGMLDNTVIGNHVIIDNQVQIGHNVTIGDGTAIAGCVGIAGSTSIGKNCLIGGASSINGHIDITDKVIITGTSAVNHSITKSGIYSSGLPARENSEWRKNVARFMFLDSMAKKIKEIEKSIKTLNIATDKVG